MTVRTVNVLSEVLHTAELYILYEVAFGHMQTEECFLHLIPVHSCFVTLLIFNIKTTQ